MTDFLLMLSLGFLGSFGHCLGMCGPLTVAFSLIDRPNQSLRNGRSHLTFHLWLNLGRLLSYGIVGGIIGTIGSVLIAGGQLAGIGSGLRQGLAILTGSLLIWFGLHQIQPRWLPRVPLLASFGGLHDRLNQKMLQFSQVSPIGLGLLWGLMPCGFLYAAQIKAASSGNPMLGALTMLAFGLGTLPMMVGIGGSSRWLSRDRRSQLFRLGGWVTLTIGLLTVTRNSAMVDHTGHAALILLGLALIARPIARIWAGPLQYRRGIGVGAFFCAIAHVSHTFSHSFEWNLQAWRFLLPSQQWGFWLGAIAVGLLVPLAITSTDRQMQKWGTNWRSLHLLSVPALIFAAGHSLLLGSSYFGALTLSSGQGWRVGGLIFGVVAVLGLRSRYGWSVVGQGKWYVSAQQRIRVEQSGDRCDDQSSCNDDGDANGDRP